MPAVHVERASSELCVLAVRRHCVARTKDRSAIPWGVAIQPLNPHVEMHVHILIRFHA